MRSYSSSREPPDQNAVSKVTAWALRRRNHRIFSKMIAQHQTEAINNRMMTALTMTSARKKSDHIEKS